MAKNKFHIIRILSDTKFIIDGGKEDGLKQDSKFEIRGGDEEPVTNLQGKVIGYIGAPKANLYMYELHDNFSILASKLIEAHTIPGFSDLMRASSLGNLYSEKKVPAHYKRLPIDETQMQPLNDDSPIKKGDVVIVINSQK